MGKPFIFQLKEQYQGDTINPIVIRDIKVGGVAVDLSIAEICMQVRSSANDMVYEAKKGSGITLTANDAITIESFIINDYGNFVADIQFSFPGGIERTWYILKIPVARDVTEKSV